MLNWLWGLMIIIGVSYGIVTGNAEAVSNASIDGAKDAVTMSITMLGIMACYEKALLPHPAFLLQDL